MRRVLAAAAATVLLAVLSLGRQESAEAIPYFARKYGVACATCHVAPPKLNAFGEAFVANGYRMPELTGRPTWPFAIWLSGRTESLASGADVDPYVNRVEVISGGRLVAPWLSYFVEWRPVSLEARADGSLRDRSGRFEDLFLTAAGEHLQVTAGQFRQVAQVDVSRRMGISEPLVLAAALPGGGAGSARAISLRGFSPAGRSPSLRVAWTDVARDVWRWTVSAALPVPGELSVPLTDEASVEASNELELDPKGVFLESFVRRGLTSLGAHLFYDASDRFLVNAVTTGNRGLLHWTAIGGVARLDGELHERWSLEAELFPVTYVGVGGRIEDRAEDGVDPIFLPYLNLHFPGTRYTFRLTLEQRVQEGNDATLVEFGTIF